MPKKSRRNRGKKKAAASEGSAAASVPGEPGVMETDGDLPQDERECRLELVVVLGSSYEARSLQSEETI